MRLDDVHGPVEALLNQDLEAVTLDQPIAIAWLLGQGESDAAPHAGQSDRCRRVEPAGRLVGSLKDLCRPLRELDHESMLAKVRVGPADGLPVPTIPGSWPNRTAQYQARAMNARAAAYPSRPTVLS
jgi:hypothetical protein